MIFGSPLAAAALLLFSTASDYTASSMSIVRPAREIEAPAAWSYKSSPSSRERCQWDGVPGPLLSVHQLAMPSDHETAQDKGSCLPWPSGIATGHEAESSALSSAPMPGGYGPRVFSHVVPTMLTSEREPAALESAPGDDRVTRLSATRRPAFLPLAPPTPGRLNHPIAAGPESVLVSSVGTTTPEDTPEGSDPGRGVPAPPGADLDTTAPDAASGVGVDPGPLSPAADTGGVALPRLRLWFRDETDGPGSWTSGAVPVERIADDFGRDLGWIAFGVSLDLGSTSAFIRWCKTCREANPFGWDAEARLSLKVAMATTGGSVCYWLRRNGHDRLATIVRWTLFGIQALAAGSNTLHAVRGR